MNTPDPQSSPRLRLSRRSRATRGLLWGSLAIVLLVLPNLVDPYVDLQITLIIVFAVAIRGLDIVTGLAGQVSLAQSAFFGIGAYAGAYCVDRDWSAPVGFVAAVVVSALVGAAIAVPAVRLRGVAFGMVTIALPVLAVPLAVRLRSITGGSEGRSVPTITAPTWTGLADDQWHYYLVLVIGTVVFVLIHNMLNGRVGRALTMVRTNEILATSLGIPVQRYKIFAFTVAAACGGIAGWLYLIPMGFVTPDALKFTLSISILLALVIGGLRSALGCVLGAAFYVLVPNVTDSSQPGRSLLYFGAAVLLVLIFLPDGIAGAIRSVLRQFVPASWNGGATSRHTNGPTDSRTAQPEPPTASTVSTHTPTEGDAP